MCYMCCERNCSIDCYFKVGGTCKYGVEGFESDTEVTQCDPSECECMPDESEVEVYEEDAE